MDSCLTKFRQIAEWLKKKNVFPGKNVIWAPNKGFSLCQFSLGLFYLVLYTTWIGRRLDKSSIPMVKMSRLYAMIQLHDPTQTAS